MIKIYLSILLITSINLSFASNTPCSGKMGGISHCSGGNFICNNGSISRSKKFCRSENKRTNTKSSPNTEIKIYKSINKEGITSFSDNPN